MLPGLASLTYYPAFAYSPPTQALQLMRCTSPPAAIRCIRSQAIALMSAFVAWIGFALFATVRLHGAEPIAKPLQSLFDQHCNSCHSGDKPEGVLQLDTLPLDVTNVMEERQWSKVYDKLAKGEMPPASASQLSKDERDKSVDYLRRTLHHRSLANQQSEGRVVVRRLNATEYQNTLNDLLGIDIPLKELLPEDSFKAGFDNVSEALDISATHFLRYQEAAERAIQSVVPIHPPIPFAEKRTGRTMTEKGPNFREGLGRNSKLEGDSLIIYSKLPRYGLCATAAVPAGGRYKIQLKACAVGAEGKSIPVGLMRVMQSGREGPVLYDVRDIPHGEPQVIEFECDLVARQAFVVNLLTTWDIRRFKKPIEEYTGPGLLVEWLNIEGPIGDFPPKPYTVLFDDLPLKARSVVQAEMAGKRVPDTRSRRIPQHWESDPLIPASDHPKEDAQRLLNSFVPLVFRREVSKEEVDHFIQAAHRKLDDGYLFFDAMRYAYKLVLTSPDFLFLLNSRQDHKLDDYALASRLSYFLWSSAPDAELLGLAKQNQLHEAKVLHAQVERMLNSPLASRFVKNFTGQWLDLRRIDFTIPDPVLYSDFDSLLLWSMPLETHAFFDTVLREDLSLTNFVDSDWSMLNERLAALYGVPGVEGSSLRRVSLPASAHRGGVMTHASVLKVTADGTRTSPVLRGAWVLDRILGLPPAPPPPNIPPIEPDIRGATTIREQLEKHRNTQACATCHNSIDPPGFALECFDPIGNYREFYRVTTKTKAGLVDLPYGSGRPIYRGPDVEQGGQTPDGESFETVDDYKKLLLRDQDQLARNLTQKILIYSTGADIQFADREIVEQIVRELKSKQYGLRTLIHYVVQSRPFLNQ